MLTLQFDLVNLWEITGWKETSSYIYDDLGKAIGN